MRYPPRSGSRHRASHHWPVRIALALAIAIIGYISVVQSWAFTIRKRDPLHAHRLSPSEGRITALAAQQLAGADATPATRTRADALARRALLQDPTAVLAAATLGLDTQLRGDVSGARRLFAYANYLSRREFQVQVWGIEDAVMRGDIPGALHQYDIALRVSRSAPDLLYPVLSDALAEPAVQAGLVRLLAKNPPWGYSFVNFASANAAPAPAIRFFKGLARASVTVTDEPRARIIDRLLAQQKPQEAWDYYVGTRRAIDPRVSRDPTFSNDAAIPTAFDWINVNNDIGIATTLQPGVFDFSAPASVGGVLLRQMLLLPPGTYRMVGRSSGIDQAADSQPYWRLRCGDDDQGAGRVAVPNSAQNKGLFSGVFVVHAGCPVQALELVAQPSEAVGGLSGQITRAQLTPLTAGNAS